MGNTTDRVGRHLESLARREVAKFVDGAAFAFGAAVPSAAEIRTIAARFEQIRDDVVDTDKRIEIVSKASSPGADDANQSLSNQRGEWLRQWLIAQGVDADRITVSARGESESDQIGDSAYDRLALWVIADPVEHVISDPSLFLETLHDRLDTLAEDREAGMEKIVAAVEPYAEVIRSLYHLPKNSIFPDPSADPKQLGLQALTMVADILGIPTSPEDVVTDKVKDKLIEEALGEALGNAAGYAETIAKYGAGLQMGWVRDTLKDEVAEARRLLFNALEQALAAALDPTYEPDLDGMPPIQRAFFDAFYASVSALPPEDQYQMFLASLDAHLSKNNWSFDLEYLKTHADGATIASGADFIFFDSDYRTDSNDPGSVLLFGLKIDDSDGHIQLKDFATNSSESFDKIRARQEEQVAADYSDDDTGGLCLPEDDETADPDDEEVGATDDDDVSGQSDDHSTDDDQPTEQAPPEGGQKSASPDDDVENGLCLPDDESLPEDADVENGLCLPDDESLPEDDDVEHGMSLPEDDDAAPPSDDGMPGHDGEDDIAPDAGEGGSEGVNPGGP